MLRPHELHKLNFFKTSLYSNRLYFFSSHTVLPQNSANGRYGHFSPSSFQHSLTNFMLLYSGVF